MRRFALLILAVTIVTTIAMPAAAGRHRGRDALLDLVGSSCGLAQAVDEALAAAPGRVLAARLKSSQKPGKDAIQFYRVVSRDAEVPSADLPTARRVQRFDARSCEAISPVPPVVDMPDAIEAALAELGGGFLVNAHLRFPGLEPVYRVVALRPGSHRKRVVLIDGVSGEVLVSRPWIRRLDEAEDASDDDDGGM